MYVAVVEWDGGNLAMAMSTTPKEAFFLAWQEIIRQPNDPPAPHPFKDFEGKEMTKEVVLPDVDWHTSDGGKFVAEGFSNGFDFLESCSYPIQVYEPRFDVKGFVIPLKADKAMGKIKEELDKMKSILKAFKDLLEG